MTRLMSPAKRLDNELCTRYSFLYVYISALLLLLFFVLFCFVFSPATLSTKRGYKKKRGQRPPSTLSLYNRFLFFRQTIILHTQPRSTYTHTHKSRLLLLLFMCMFVFVTVVTLQKLFHSPPPSLFIFFYYLISCPLGVMRPSHLHPDGPTDSARAHTNTRNVITIRF